MNDIYFGDCLEDMKLLPDSSVDMILCDLPYGTTQNKWDSILSLDKLWAEYKRIAKPNAAIVLTAAQPFTSILVASALPLFKYEWIWHKSKVTNVLNAKKQPLREHESVLVFSYGTLPYFPQGLLPCKKRSNTGNSKVGSSQNYGKIAQTADGTYEQTATNYPRSVLTIASEGKTQHPTQKPVALFEYLVRTYTNEGDTVLDNCAGSGTTGVACVNTNRKYILMEKEQKYLDIIYERLGIKEDSNAISR